MRIQIQRNPNIIGDILKKNIYKDIYVVWIARKISEYEKYPEEQKKIDRDY